ncbi:HTH_CenpB-type DNA-binding domain [Hexamita inflata]|uniref:HTH CenpB-type DNA-binding domain n=1 Tax=Hexamita inflata TaxID=28002 RepID=A0AA86QV32_9EUKA|nr:HTH CenpB-type DNA-binding domain [Hexamita inflata]
MKATDKLNNVKIRKEGTYYPYIEETLYYYLMEHNCVTRQDIIQYAQQIVRNLPEDHEDEKDFKASGSYIEGFFRRHNLRFHVAPKRLLLIYNSQLKTFRKKSMILLNSTVLLKVQLQILTRQVFARQCIKSTLLVKKITLSKRKINALCQKQLLTINVTVEIITHCV